MNAWPPEVGEMIGILALQGAFARHANMLEKLGIPHQLVRYPHELSSCMGLIIPGGESTVMTHQIKAMNLLNTLKDFAQSRPIFGTCAGMILMAREGILSLLDISVNRNAYGRQSESFCVQLNFLDAPLPACFIRAPRITKIHSPEVTTLAEFEGEPVLIQQGFHLAAAFHPELTNDARIHKYFFELCTVRQSLPQPSRITPTKCFQMI